MEQPLSTVERNKIAQHHAQYGCEKKGSLKRVQKKYKTNADNKRIELQSSQQQEISRHEKGQARQLL